MSNDASTRLESDLLGVPADAYYGVQTLRAMENFHDHRDPARPLPGTSSVPWRWSSWPRRGPTHELGLLDETEIASAIDRACSGDHRRPLARPLRGRRGPGRRRHLDQHERQRGHRQPRARAARPRARRVPHCHPNNHVNLSQSTNDAYPTAVPGRGRARARRAPGEKLGRPSRPTSGAKQRSSARFLKMGRTQLQDAVPHDPRSGVRRLRGDHGRGHRAARRDGSALSSRSTSAAPPSAPGSTRTPATPARGGSPGRRSRSGPRPRRRIWSRRHRTRGPSFPSQGCSNGSGRQALQDLQRPPAALVGPAVRAQ
jgi:hypothetical protein